jgi:hypothetical protein
MLNKREKLIGTPHSKPFIADNNEEKENKTSNNMGSFVPTTPMTVCPYYVHRHYTKHS